MQLTKAYVAETSCISVIDSATYVLTISLPNIDSVAMRLYDMKYLVTKHIIAVKVIFS